MNNEHVNQYAERDAMQLDKDGGYYSRHIQAMTREGLHSKGDIAAELAWRDQQIGQLKADLEERRKADSAEPLAWTDEEELRDLRKVGFCEMFSVEPISKDADMLRVIPLYRHSQPAPVVPDEIEPGSNNTYDYVDGWNACRAAMLQSKYRYLSQPVDPQISEYEKIMLQAGNSPTVKFDSRYITTRLEVFEDTYEIAVWLERIADGCCDPGDKYGLRESATSLCGMYADLKEFGEALIQIQGKSGPEAGND